MFCLTCKCLTLEGENCERCGKPLPGIVPPPRADFKSPELRQMTMSYRTGDITRVALTAYLDKQESSLWKIYEETEQEKIPPECYPELKAELDTGRQALILFAKALELVRDWIGTGSNETLKVAHGLAAQCDSLINDAIAMNFATSKNHMMALQEYMRARQNAV